MTHRLRVKFSQALASSTSLFAIGMVILWFVELPLSLSGRLGNWAWPLGIILGVLIYAVVFYLTRLFWPYSDGMRSLMGRLHNLFRDFSWPAIILISIMAGLGEELLLRGLLQTYLVRELSPFWGIVLASLIFGLLHYLSRAYIVVTFALGVVFGVAYYLSNSLMLVMIAHAVYDVFAFAVLVKYPKLLYIQ